MENTLSWLALREAALASVDAQQSVDAASLQFYERTESAATALADALAVAGEQIAEGTDLMALVLRGEQLTSAAEAARGKREGLATQLTAAQANLAALKQEADEAESDLEQWRNAWSDVVKAIGLSGEADLATGESALEQLGRIETEIENMREIRVKRIETMQADLNAFDRDAERVARQVDFALVGSPAATVASTLAQRLQVARETKREHERLTAELLTAKKHLQNAEDAISQTKARITPLQTRVGADSTEKLIEAIRKSGLKRELLQSIAGLTKALVENGDGFEREALEKEIDAGNLLQIPADLLDLKQQLEDSLTKQQAVAAELATAQSALDKIGGSDAAAQAEAERQNALTEMAEAAERYVEIATSARLLRWAIDQYRDKKQAPLLARASTIFAGLTRGAFQKLHVDYEVAPPALEGIRPDGKRVGVTGLSEGTRDQLYLALRLAALELHLETAHVMPFVADDLFINFDDDRAEAGFQSLADLSEKMQVVFLSHHDHLTERVRKVFGEDVNIVRL